MPVTAVVGGQWGDEGKGKVINLLARDADLVVRGHGGANAGHTVVIESGRFAVHLDDHTLSAEAWGEPLDIARHQPAVEVKGATYTSLSVARDSAGRWVAQCVIDV